MSTNDVHVVQERGSQNSHSEAHIHAAFLTTAELSTANTEKKASRYKLVFENIRLSSLLVFTF